MARKDFVLAVYIILNGEEKPVGCIGYHTNDPLIPHYTSHNHTMGNLLSKKETESPVKNNWIPE